jgi:hypothetical protein
MPTPRSSPITRRCLAWLLWLGLLLPFAQVAAVAHSLAHVRSEQGRDADGKQAPRATHCDLCLLGAAVGSAVPLAHVAPPTLLAVSHATPQAVRAQVRAEVPAHPYRSRAPPDASR